MKAARFTAAELILFVCNFSFGVVGGVWGWRRYGWVGLVFGFVSGFAIIPFVLYIVFKIIALFWTGKPPLPVCRSGKCKYEDYRPVELENGELGYVCQCGVRYRKKGRLVFEILPNGEQKLYMKWMAFKGWIARSGAGEASFGN